MSQTLQLDPKTTALVLIDLQNGIVARDTAPYTAAQVLEKARAMAEAFRAKGAPVVYVHVLLDHIIQLDADEPTQVPPNIPPAAMEIAADAGMQPGDLLVAKHHWGAFAQTELEQKLRDRGLTTVVIGGIATNIGVESTVRQGTGLGFNFVIVEDACATFSAEMQKFAFSTIFPRLGRVRTAQQVIDAFK